MYSVVDAMLLRPPPFEQPDRLVILFNTSLTPGGGRQRLCWSFANITGMEHIGRSFDGVGSFSEPLFTVSGRGEPEHVDGETASREYVQALRIRPVAGRLFTAQESAVSGAEPVALIGERLWNERSRATRRSSIGAAAGMVGSVAAARLAQGLLIRRRLGSASAGRRRGGHDRRGSARRLRPARRAGAIDPIVASRND